MRKKIKQARLIQLHRPGSGPRFSATLRLSLKFIPRSNAPKSPVFIRVIRVIRGLQTNFVGPFLCFVLLVGRGTDCGQRAMITFLHGKLAEALPTCVSVDVGGVGYEVLIPLSSFDKLPPVGSEVRLLTHLSIREDAHVLYGFSSAAERDLFRLLIHNVSGVGPKIALNVLSGMSVNAFRGAVAAGDIKALSQISGVGRKTAERIVVELKDKVGQAGALESATPNRVATGGDQRVQDAVAALAALGVKFAEAQESVRAARALLGENASVEELVRACFKKGA